MSIGSLHFVNRRMTIGVDLVLVQLEGIAVEGAVVDLAGHKGLLPGLPWNKRKNKERFSCNRPHNNKKLKGAEGEELEVCVSQIFC